MPYGFKKEHPDGICTGNRVVVSFRALVHDNLIFLDDPYN